MKKLSDNIRKPWPKATLKDINNIINNQTFLIEDKNEGEPVTPCMDVYKSKIQSDGSLDKLKLRIVVRGDLQNKEMVGDTWSPTVINNQTFLLEDQNEGEPVTPCMDVYKSKIQSDGSLDKLKLRIVVRGDLQNK